MKICISEWLSFVQTFICGRKDSCWLCWKILNRASQEHHHLQVIYRAVVQYTLQQNAYLFISYFHENSLFCLAERHLIKINNTRGLMKPRPNAWWNVATGDIPKFENYRLRRIYARTVHHRFWLASYERLNILSTKYEHKYSVDLHCFETRRWFSII